MADRNFGVLRSFLHYRYEDSIELFFKILNIKPVYSQSSEKSSDAEEIIDDEACLPLKKAGSHLLWLLRNTNEKIILPRWVSSRYKRYFCPKIMGFSQIAKNYAPDRIILLPINFHKGFSKFLQDMYNFSQEINLPYLKVLRAFYMMISHYKKQKDISQNFCSFIQEKKLRIGIIGHPYILFDNELNLGLLKIIEAREDVLCIYPHNIKKEFYSDGQIVQGDFWTSYQDTVRTGIALLTEYRVDGIIHFVSFGCGPDSMLSKILEFECRRRNFYSYIRLILDEQDALTGYQTRLEAFFDMLYGQKKCTE